MKKALSVLMILAVCTGIVPVFAQQTVTSFTLINADTDKPIRTMVAGEVLDYTALGTRNINFVANTNPATVGSVVISVNSTARTENVAPYAYAGDDVTSSGVKYRPINPVLAAGSYTLTAVPYSSANKGGTQGRSLSINFSVKGTTTTNQPPTVNAGGNKSLVLPTNSIILNGTASDPDGSIASVAWTKASGPSATMSNANTNNLTLSNLVAGTYVFTFRATDNQGASSSANATVTVTASNTTGQTVTTFTLINADNNQDIRTLTNGDVLDYSKLPTRNLNIRANTNPTTVGSVVFSHNGKLKNENAGPYALAGDNVTSSGVNYNALNPALAVGSHTLTATPFTSANGGGTRGNALTVSFSVTEGTSTGNKAPVANAGTDKTLTLPTNSVVLNGSGTDSDGTIASYAWTKVSGPSATMSGSTSQNLSLSNLLEGTYVFRLTVRDNGGATGFDDAVVTVKPASTGGGGGGSCTAFNEQNGLVVMEVESMPTVSDWSLRTAVGGSTGRGYYEWRHGNSATSTIPAGTGVLTYTVKINNPGRYRLQIRSAAPHRTEHNDVWVRFPEGKASGIKGTSVLNLAANWFKVYQNSGSNSWTWDTKTKDHDPHDIFVDFSTAGTYRVQLSGRSTQFKVDRLVLYRAGVASTTALSTSTPQSGCASSSSATIAQENYMPVMDEARMEVYPNPSAGNVSIEFSASVEGPATLELYNINGQLVQRLFSGHAEKGRTYTVDFDASLLPDGMYLSRLVSADKVVTKQIIFRK
jgi:hypothetical protein